MLSPRASFLFNAVAFVGATVTTGILATDASVYLLGGGIANVFGQELATNWFKSWMDFSTYQPFKIPALISGGITAGLYLQAARYAAMKPQHVLLLPRFGRP